MIDLVRDPFDSGLWKKNVFKLRLRPPTPMTEDVRAVIEVAHPDVVFAFVPFAHPAIEICEALGFSLISIRSTYVLSDQTPAAAPSLPTGVEVASLGDAPNVSDDDILAMVETIGGTSRYFNDRRIPRSDATALYEAWIRNSLSGGYADEAFMVLRGGRMVGLITLKVRDGRGFVDLIGVLPAHQNAGFGSLLLERAAGFFRARRVTEIVAVTEGENVNANAFYQRRGFLLQNVELVYHKHLPNV